MNNIHNLDKQNICLKDNNNINKAIINTPIIAYIICVIGSIILSNATTSTTDL